jgi:hypothetical protein
VPTHQFVKESETKWRHQTESALKQFETLLNIKNSRRDNAGMSSNEERCDLGFAGKVICIGCVKKIMSQQQQQNLFQTL